MKVTVRYHCKSKGKFSHKQSNRIADYKNTSRLGSSARSSDPKCSLQAWGWAEQTCRGRRPWVMLGRTQGALDCRAINLVGPFQLCHVVHKLHQGL